MPPTVVPGALTVLSAYPDPPFELMRDGAATGFDIELMRAVSGRLGLELRPVAFEGDDFNAIFDGLLNGTCDAVISGATITPERAAKVRFSQPYLAFDQGIAVNRRITPNAASFADLRGLTAGIRVGKHIRSRRAAAPGAGRYRRDKILSLSRHSFGDRRSGGRTHRARHQAAPGCRLAGERPVRPCCPAASADRRAARRRLRSRSR